MTAQATHDELHQLTTQWGDALSELDASGIELMSELLSGEATYGEVRMRVETCGDGWRVGVSTDARSNVLPLVAGLLTSNGLDISQADIYTVGPASRPTERTPRRQPARRTASTNVHRRRRRAPSNSATRGTQRRVAMLFELRERSTGIPGWDEIEQDIRTAARQALTGRVDSATSAVIDRFSDAMREAGQGGGDQLPIDIFTDVESSDRFTLITISSIDTPGFLFSFTNALASIHINIARATIRTYDDVVRDTFWLTDSSGSKIEDDHRLNQLWVAAALIKQFTYYLPIAPDPTLALRQFNSLTSQLLAMRDWTSKLHDLDSPDVMEILARMMGMSRFLWEDFLRMQHDNLFPVLLDSESLDRALSLDGLEALIDSDLDTCDSHDERMRSLNDFKDREMFRVDLRFITGRVGLGQFSRELTSIADVLTRKAFEIGYSFVAARHGVPRTQGGGVCGWGIFALGKFGGRDMGFGSDIELMFIYDSEGMTDGNDPVRNSTFFEEVVKEFLNVLEVRTQGIFEIDMRLRPYGSKGPLASSLGAFRDYYSPDGDARQFERMALVRMRPVLGEEELIKSVMSAQDSFVYSREPLDIGDILHMRRRQANELVKRGSVNAKLSPGGVVDIEYYVQAWQITRGRDDRELRLTNTLEAVESLRETGHLDDSLAAGISDAYTLLRKLIDGLRIVRGNAKDLDIPARDSKEYQSLAHRMSEHGSDHLNAHVSEHMGFAKRLWEDYPPPT
ncbi:MAG: hypothetical protein OXC95_00790 [Dehalococcoidia bacterium]|nr:hypothetical protein [Dehalococcoidia bacterium]